MKRHVVTRRSDGGVRLAKGEKELEKSKNTAWHKLPSTEPLDASQKRAHCDAFHTDGGQASALRPPLIYGRIIFNRFIFGVCLNAYGVYV